jgi:NADPH-dependent 2,4-dienoyl-CoA reductase/sulfur reductase-like enzyme
MIIADDSGGTIPKELTVEEIRQLVDCFAHAARRAKKAGFDGVSIHAAHGYLVNSFLSPFTNKRRDSYGGDREGRCRFLLEIIREVRKEIGHLPILVKISGDEYVSGGLSIADTKGIAPLIEEAGADAIIVSAGTVGQTEEQFPLNKPAHTFLRSLPMYTARGCYVYMAGEIKEEVRIPVIAVGRINTPALVREIVEQDKADLVVLGRALLADPLFPRKMEDGKESDIRVCIACNQGCIENLFHQRPITCAINPRAGREGELTVDRTEKPRKIAIIGGGPAGMEAARVSSLRGHAVRLFEADDQLGGQLRLACKAPGREEIKSYLDFLLGQMEKLPVEVFTNSKVNSSLLRDLGPDILIFATGASPWIPEFVQPDGDGIVTAEEVLNGEKEIGDVAIIAGGGLVGCEVAELLGEKGKKVTIVEMLADIIPDEFADTKKYFENALATYGIQVLTESVIKRIAKGSVVIETKEGEAKSLSGDTVVLAMGYASDIDLKREIEVGSGCEVHEIGDCVKPRKIMDAVLDAYELASSL